VADEWVTQLLRQGDAKVFKKYSEMKPADEKGGACRRSTARRTKTARGFYHGEGQGFVTVGAILARFGQRGSIGNIGSGLKSKKH
jgi:hypothetical protein